MTDHRCIAGSQCRGVESVDDTTTGKTIRQAALIEQEHGLCEKCRGAAEHAINDLTETWLALHMSIGDMSRRNGQRVRGSRSMPINVNTDADALKVALVEWVSAAASRVAQVLNIRYDDEDDSNEPQPRNSTDHEHARALLAAVRLLGPNVDRLIGLEAEDVTVWLTASETDHAGESIPCSVSRTGYRPNTREIPMSGAELALKLMDLRRKARSFLALTAPVDKLSLPCPRCNEYELTRTHRTINQLSGKPKEVDKIDCGACHLDWPYERYQHLIHIWVREDEMERDKLQKQLDAERERRETAEFRLAKHDWWFNLAVGGVFGPDVSAAAFAATVLSDPDYPEEGELLTDKDVANLVGVSDSTVRGWASKGFIERHTADDGSVLFLATEVWAYAKSHPDPKTQTVRRLGAARCVNEPCTP